MEQITEKDLEGLLERINKNTTDSHRYILDYTYGGVTMHKVTNAGGRVSEVFGAGHMRRPRLYDLMRAFIAGVEGARDIIIK